jgi:photosynthetic reaction center cytochrome c subunit
VTYNQRFAAVVAVLVVAALAVLTLERPPVETVQRGFRGTGMLQVYNPRTVAAMEANNVVPAGIAPVPSVGPKAGDIYRNVTVLGDLSVGEFTRLMAALTTWVAPEQGCAYCHMGNDMAAEGNYTKNVARRMLQMTRHINEQWGSHVSPSGVTCYTCHRGQPVPQHVWTTEAYDTPVAQRGMAHVVTGQNLGAPSVNFTSLPYDPFTPFLQQGQEIRVIGHIPEANGDNLRSIKQAEWTYGLMTNISQSLGVNCTYCHNSRSFAEWDQSPPQRAIAWYGIRMTRDINNAYIEPLREIVPPNRLGPHGDTLKTNCATCHQGVYKPLYGARMAQDYPELMRANLTAPIRPPAR